MPQAILIPVLGAFASTAASAAFGPKGPTGAANWIFGPKTTTTPAVEEDPGKAAAIRAEQLAKARILREQLPSLQESVGGSVSPEYYAQMIRMLSGLGSDVGLSEEIARSYFGIGTPGGGTSGGPSGGLAFSPESAGSFGGDIGFGGDVALYDKGIGGVGFDFMKEAGYF